MPIARLKRHPRAAIGLGLMVAAGMVLALLGRELDATMLLDHGRRLTDWVAANPLISMIGFFMFAVLGKIGPVPGGLVVILSGGFLFGGVWGALLSATGGGVTAMLITLIGRRFFQEWLIDRHGDRIERVRTLLGRDAFWVVLALRLTPVTPAWFGNLIPIPLPIHPISVWLATTIGVLPISFTVAFLGSELQSLTEITKISPDEVFTAELLVPLFALAALSLLPIYIRRRFAKRRHAEVES